MAKIPMKAARVAAGFTQEQLAEKLGVSRATVIGWESGAIEIRPLNLFAFCHVTGFSEDDILLPKISTKRELCKA